MTSPMLAAVSAMLTCFFFMGAGGLLLLIWRDRRRFTYWRAMGPQGRADTILHGSLVGVLAIAGYHRAVATYSFIADLWVVPSTPKTAALYLPLHLVAMAGVLWWVCVELCGSRCGGWTWAVLMAVTAAMGAGAYILDGVVT